MEFLNYYTNVLKQYAVFSGRLSRKGYWMFVLINLIVYVVLYTLESLINTQGILVFVYMLAILLPSLGAAIRRMHDTNKSGWWLLVSFIPFVGGIVTIVLLAMAGTPGDNNYGSPDGASPTQPTATPEPEPLQTEPMTPANQPTV